MANRVLAPVDLGVVAKGIRIGLVKRSQGVDDGGFAVGNTDGFRVEFEAIAGVEDEGFFNSVAGVEGLVEGADLGFVQSVAFPFLHGNGFVVDRDQQKLA